MTALAGSMFESASDREINGTASPRRNRYVRYGLLMLVIIVLAIPFVLAVYFA